MLILLWFSSIALRFLKPPFCSAEKCNADPPHSDEHRIKSLFQVGLNNIAVAYSFTNEW